MSSLSFNQTGAYLGLLTTGLLILFTFIYILYILFVKKYSYRNEYILIVLLLFIIAIGIHSLQHQALADSERNVRF